VTSGRKGSWMLGVLVGDVVEELLLPSILAAIMFAIGLELQPAAFAATALGRRPLVAGLVSLALVVPALGTVLAFALVEDPTLRMGMILLAVCPIGILSSAMTHLYGGRVPLAFTLTLAASVLYVVFAPVAIRLGLDATYGSAGPVDVPAVTLFWRIVMVTVIPVASGMAVAKLAPSFAARAAAPLGTALTLPLLAIFVWIVFRQRAAIGEAPAIVVALVLTANIVNAAAALFTSRLMRLDRAEARAVLVCHLVRQEGTGIFVAVSVLRMPEIAVPLIVNTIVGLIVCAALWLPMRDVL
jgi:BASS family bile acid:Na+ symporter